LVEGAGGRATVEFSEVRVVNADEGSRNGSEFNIKVISVDIAKIVEVRKT
jgi:hypothetical protein